MKLLAFSLSGVSLCVCCLFACGGGAAVTESGESVYQAADKGDIGPIRGAVRDGFKINTPDENGDTVLHHAAAMNQGQLIEMLIEEMGASRFIKDKDGKTPLDIAQERGNADAIQALSADS